MIQQGNRIISVFDAARRLCEVSDWTVTNLQLHKILYLIQMVYMGDFQGRRLIGTSFQAWDYGPVSPELYHRAKIFGAKPIGNVFHGASFIHNQDDEDFFVEMAGHFLKFTPAQLVAMTHWDDGAWAKNYRPDGRGLIISDRDMLDEHKKRRAKVEAKRKAAIS